MATTNIYLKYKKRKKEGANTKSFSIEIFFVLITTISLSYFAAFILGFSGILAWWDAVNDPILGKYVLLFLVTISGIVSIGLYQKTLSWNIAKKWLIAEATLVVITAIAVSFVPGLNLRNHPWFQQQEIIAMEMATQAGTCFQVTESNAFLYKLEKENVFKETTKKKEAIKLSQGEKYHILREGDVRQIGPLKFIPIYYMINVTASGQTMQTGWVNLDDGAVVKKTAPKEFVMARLSDGKYKVTFCNNQPITILEIKKGTEFKFVNASDPNSIFFYESGTKQYFPIPLNSIFNPDKTFLLVMKGNIGDSFIIESSKLSI